MTAEELKALQAPLKERYRSQPETARATLTARGTLDVPRIVCRVETGRPPVTEAGLHERTGGDGSMACAAEMLLESLVACAGVTLCAVATAMALPVAGGTVVAEGDLDFRGTLGVDRNVPVGFTAIRLRFELDTDAADEQLEKLARLAERYCVVAQTLTAGVPLELRCARR